MLIFEEPPPMNFAPAMASTPYGPSDRWPGSEYPSAPPLGGASRMFMAPLSRLMHPRSAALRSPSRGEAPTSFSAPYPMVPPPVTAAAIVHSPNPRPIAGVHPMATTVDDITQ